MPGLEVHLFVDRLLFGREYKDLHRAIDYPVKFFGKGHRKFFHSVTEAAEFAMFRYPWDNDAILAGRMHIWVDWECTHNKSFCRLLESEAKKDKKWRKNPMKPIVRKITANDLYLGFYLCPENNLQVSRKSCVKRKKKSKKMDEFSKFIKAYKRR